MNKKILPPLLAFFFASGVLIAVLGACSLDYAVNKVIIDAIPGDSLQWWQTYTYPHYITWVYVYDPSGFTAILVLWVIMTYIISCVGLVFYFHNKEHPLFDDSELEQTFKTNDGLGK